MKYYAIIPARAGSKGIPNKNLQKIKNKSLLQMATDAAIEADIFDKIYVTTDIPIVLEEEPESVWVENHSRPDRLATDSAVQTDVVLDVLNTYCVPDDAWFWLLQPTSPFRTNLDFDFIDQKISTRRYKSVISVKDVGCNHPDRMYSIKGGGLYPSRHTDFRNRQDLPPRFIRNGSFYCARAGDFRAQKTFYIPECAYHLMDEERSINIDNQIDLVVAKVVAETWPS